MQMQPRMAAYHPNNVTTDHIQQYLDENKSLILKIVESQNAGKLSECAENQARLQRNLMYLAAIADSQPQVQPQHQPPLTMHPQHSSSAIMAGGGHHMLHQQPQQMTPQSLMAAWSSMVYSQPFSTLQQQQAFHTLSSPGNSNLHMLQTENNPGPYSGLGAFADFGHRALGGGGTKPDIESSGSADRRAGSSGGDMGETLYLKAGDDGN